MSSEAEDLRTKVECLCQDLLKIKRVLTLNRRLRMEAFERIEEIDIALAVRERRFIPNNEDRVTYSKRNNEETSLDNVILRIWHNKSTDSSQNREENFAFPAVEALKYPQLTDYEIYFNLIQRGHNSNASSEETNKLAVFGTEIDFYNCIRLIIASKLIFQHHCLGELYPSYSQTRVRALLKSLKNRSDGQTLDPESAQKITNEILHALNIDRPN